MENKIDYSGFVELYDELTRLRILKNFIRENIKINEEEKVETNLFLADDLVNLIKYIDTKFYNELKQQKAEQ